MVKGIWWKLVGAVLILYSLIVGLAVPLNTGIVNIDQRNAVEGENLVLSVETYNTEYSNVRDKNLISAWLKAGDDQVFKATEVEMKGDHQLSIIFKIPVLDFQEQEILSASLYISDPIHGYSVLPSAVFIKDNKSLSEVDKDAFTDLSSIHRSDEIHFPFRNILLETIRNTYYHVPLWFAMVLLFAFSAFCSAQYLRKREIHWDKHSAALSEVGVLFGLLGFFTGAIWAKYTWGAFWSWDIKQFTSAVAILIYLAYFVLRSSVSDHDKRARITSSFNIFAFIMLIPLLFIIPRLTSSLHPGSGGNPAMGGEDLDNTMRMVFYPAVVGWMLMGLWISKVRYKLNVLSYENEEIR